MKKPPSYWYKAKKILSKRDPILRKIIKNITTGFLTTKNKPFFSLCRTIIGQQISIKAADSIWLKFEKKCKKKINSKNCIKIIYSYFKKRRLSRQKVSYLKNIAKNFKNKSFDIKKIKKMNDNDAINYITQLKGLRSMERSNVFNV